MTAEKIYVIATEDGFIGKAKTKNGHYKSVSGADFSKVWFTTDIVHATLMESLCIKDHAYNRFAMGVGLLEIDNSDGTYDDDIKSLKL